MNKLIIVPGALDGVFFLNEIEMINSYFDEVVAVCYPGDDNVYREIAKKHKFKYYIVPSFSIKSILKLDSLRFLFSTSVIREVLEVVRNREKVLLRLAYIVYYILFLINGKEFIEKEITNSINSNVCLYSFWLSRGSYLISSFNVNRYKNVKLILSRAHGYDLYEERNNSKYLPFRKYIFNNLDEIHFISNNGMDYFGSKYNEVTKKYVTRLGTKKSTKVKIIVSKKEICIASCSSIDNNKRLDLIIDILSYLEIPFYWIHVGTGEQEEIIKSYASTKLQNENFEFLGHIDNDKIIDLYIKFDVDYFINMSDSEGIPVSIMEAISIGIPIIARDVGGINEIVSNDNGLILNNIVDRGKMYSLINEFIRKRLDDYNFYQSLQIECLKLWESNYNAKHNLSKFFEGIIDKINNASDVNNTLPSECSL